MRFILRYSNCNSICSKRHLDCAQLDWRCTTWFIGCIRYIYRQKLCTLSQIKFFIATRNEVLVMLSLIRRFKPLNIPVIQVRCAFSCTWEQLWLDVLHDITTMTSLHFSGNSIVVRWRKYSGPCVMQVLRKFRSCSVHVAPLETAGIFYVEMIP